MPSKVAALMIRFRSVIGPSVIEEKGSGAHWTGGGITRRNYRDGAPEGESVTGSPSKTGPKKIEQDDARRRASTSARSSTSLFS